MRMLMELRVAESAHFVTLTYNEKNVPMVVNYNHVELTLDKKDLQNFLKRLRHFIMQNEDAPGRWIKYEYSPLHKKMAYSPKIRYFACGEYGKNGDRPHYHLVLYNTPLEYFQEDPRNGKLFSDELSEIWNKGIVDIGKVERGSAHYVAKYTLKGVLDEWNYRDIRQEPFATMSRKPGIGQGYVDDNIKNYFNSSKNSYATLKNGIKQPLGRYYKEKIFEEDETLKEVQRRAGEYGRKKDEQQRALYATEGDFLLAKRIESFEAIRKIKRNMKKGKL